MSNFFNELENELYLIRPKEDELYPVNNKVEVRNDWHQKRLGKLTSSRYEHMMQKGKGSRFGTMAMNYIYEKVAELLTNAPHVVTSQAMEWGTNMEAEAILKYQEEKGLIVTQSDFVPFGEFAGGSPDGLVDETGIVEEDGIIEVKCPFNPANHAETIITDAVPDKHMMQIQGNLMATGRKWCDFISYDPRVQNEALRLFVKRVYRDEEIINELKERIVEVSEKIKELYEKLK